MARKHVHPFAGSDFGPIGSNNQKPIRERQALGRSVLLFDHVERQQLAALGDVRTPSISDLFVALLGDKAGTAQGVTQ